MRHRFFRFSRFSRCRHSCHHNVPSLCLRTLPATSTNHHRFQNFITPTAHVRSRSTQSSAHAAPHHPRPYTGPAFAFDVDGVLWKSDKPIPGAVDALRQLCASTSVSRAGWRWRVPVVFLTNSGGVTERDRAARLSAALGVDVDASQVVLSHTPLRDMADAEHIRASGGCVLTVGGARCTAVVRAYGYEHTLDTSHVAAIDPLRAPFCADPARDVVVSDAERAAAKLPVAAVFAMADSANWARDIQCLFDTAVAYPDARFYFTNCDLLFPTRFHTPRIAGGALRVAFEALWHSVHCSSSKNTNHNALPPPLPNITLMGKPHPQNYAAAEHSIRSQLKTLGFDHSAPLPHIFAVGDNPPSDIRGANARGHPWHSVLVRTGNFNAKDNPQLLPPTDQPDITVDNVLHAVQHAWSECNQHDNSGSHGGSVRNNS